MLDFSFGEILVIAIIAIIFLGPDKLPKTLIDIAKFLKNMKKTIGEAKDSIDKEMQISELRKEVLSYKDKFEKSTSEIKNTIKASEVYKEANIAQIFEQDSKQDSNEDKKEGLDSNHTEGPIKRKINKMEGDGKKNLKKINLSSLDSIHNQDSKQDSNEDKKEGLDSNHIKSKDFDA